MAGAERGRRVDAGGLALHVAEHGPGDAPPVLVLHGFAGSARAMAPVVDALAARHRAIALDLVGHGRSDAPRDAAAYAWPAVTRQLERVLDALAVDRAHLFGFSLGGRVALQLAARRPGRVRSACVVGSRCAWLDEDERAARRRSDATLAARIDAEGLAALGVQDGAAGAAPACGARGLALALRGLGAADQPDVAAALAATALPVCLVAGASDTGPLAAARALAGRLPHARAVAVAGAGHRAHLERRSEVVTLAERLYAAVEREEGSTARPRARSAAPGRGEEPWST